MYSKIVWCYTVILMLLNISPNTKLTAQGNSHGGSAQDTLMEGFNFQEWGKDDAGSASGAGVMSGGVAAGVRLRPAVLSFGRRALGAAHTATVTLRNTANTTLHLASVAGTTPDFHASFFDNKSVPPDGNTTFSVVYAGRRLGPAAAQLYIHTSRGVRKYQVSAEGVASAWGVWPVLGVRAPHNATLEPVLAITNPTDTPVQVLEVYSSGAWLGLQLPGAGAGDGAGAESAPRAAWLVPPRQRRDIVRMRINMPEQQTQPLVAYIRIKTNASQAGGGGGGGGGDGGGLLVAVEARGAPAGEHARPLQLRLSARGADDSPDTFELEVGNSRGVEATLSGAARVRGARCHARPGLEPDSLEEYRDNNNANGNGQGVHTSGASVTVSRPVLGAHQPPAPAAKLTLDYSKLWAEYSAGAGLGSAGAGAGAAAYCSGWVSLGAAAVPYSVRVEPGTLRMLPDTVRVVTSLADAGREHEVRVHNQFARDVRVLHVEMDKLAEEYFHVHSPAPLWVGAGRAAVLLRVRARAEALADAARTQHTHARPLAVDARVRVLTDGQAYTVTLLMYTGLMHMEWQWPNSADGWLRVGAVGTSQTRRVGARLHNPAPARLCARDLRALLPGAQLALEQCAQHGDTHAEHSCRCVGAGQWAQAWLTVVAPAREGALHGAVLAATEHGARMHNVSLRALQGRLHALPLHLPDAAPYSWAEAELVLESSMSMRMRVVKVEPAGAGAGGAHDAALQFLPGVGGEGDVEGEGEWVESGRRAVGRVRYMPEAVCAPACYTGLDVTTPEGLAWLWRAPHADEQALRADAALLRERARMYSPQHRNITLLVHTDQVVQVTAEGWARLRWARLAGGGARAGWAGLAGVGGAVTLRLPARNPSRSHHVLLHAALGPPLPLPPLALTESSYCGGDSEPCSYSASSFRLSEWRAVRGEARPYHWEGAGSAGGAGGGAEGGLPVLVLAPGAEVELRVVFAPHAPAPLTAYLYLRNNLTILEAVQLAGRGAHASFELGGLRPGEDEPLVLEASECGGGARLTVTARNTGRVAVRLREWRVSGQPCAARGFRVTPCQPQPLAPNESRALTLAFAPDWTVARARARLTVRTDTGAHAFPLLGLAPARLLPRCLAHQPRPPFEPRLRLAARLLALAVLALVLAAAALDAERLLRRARAARAPQHAPHCPRAPLDLRALAAQHDRTPAPPAPAPAAAPAHPAARRRRARKPDPHAESRAFERWRDSLRRRDDRDEDRSSEDADEPAPPDTDCDTPAGGLLAGGRAYPRRPPPDRPPPDDRPGPGPGLRPDDRPPSSAEDRPPSSADERAPSSADDVSTTGSGRSTPPDRASDDNDPDDNDIDDRPGDDLADERESLPKSPGPSPGPPPPRAARTPPPGEAAPRGGRPRRDPPDAPRRPDRRRTPRPAAPHTPAPAGPTPTPTPTPTAAESELEAEAPAPSGSGRRGPTHGRPHSRKDKAGKRRDRPPATPPQRDSPAPAAGGPGAGAGGGAEGRAGSVRAGALWSSVVALGTPAPSPAPAPLPAPIGSDLRRRRDPPAPAHPPGRTQDDHSLFYFNGERAPLAPAPLCPAPAPARTGLSPVCGAPAGLVRPEPEYAWRAPSYTPPPLREYLGEGGAPAEGHFGTIGSVWGAGAGGGGGGGAGAAGPAGGAGAGPGAAWPWGAYSPRDTEPRRAPGSGGVRPPPGFGATPGVLPAGGGGGAGAAPGVSGGAAGGAGAGVGAGAEAGRVRAFDPFHSLASIWTRTALDWRRDDHSDPDRDDDSHADQ